MAADSTANSASPRASGSRTTPVLVPQGALVGRPDIPLDRAVTSVGSNERSRLHLVSRTVSRSHALFVNSSGGTYVMDLASRTGVLVNSKLVRDVDLKTGDRVQIGKFLFRYRSPTNAGPTLRSDAPPAAVIVVGSPAAPIIGRVALIGRRENCEISLPDDPGVSAAHAIIFQVERDWVIRDLSSRTGTIVNDKATHQQALRFGDRIKIGAATILFQPAKSPANEESLAGEPVAMPVEARAPAVARAPEPVVAEEPEEFDFPLAEEIAPATAAISVVAATPVMASANSDDTLVAAEHDDEPPAVAEAPREVAREAAVEAALEHQPEPIADAKVEPEPAVNEETPVAVDTADIEIAGIAPVPFDAVDDSVHPAETHLTASAEQASPDETLPLELAFSPGTSATEPAATEPAATESAEPIHAQVPQATIDLEPFDPATDEADQPVALDETVVIEVPTPPAEIAEPEAIEPVEFTAEKIEMAEHVAEAPVVANPEISEAETPVEFDEPIPFESDETATVSVTSAPAEVVHEPTESIEELAIHASPEPVAQEPTPVAAELIAASDAPIDEPTADLSHVAAGFSEPVERLPATPGILASNNAVPADLPEVIFWGDPDLDAAAEEAILGTHEAPLSAPMPDEAPTAEPSEPAVASSVISVEDAGGVVEPWGAADLPSNHGTDPREPIPVSNVLDESVEEISFDDELPAPERPAPERPAPERTAPEPSVPDAEPADDPLAAADAWMRATDGIDLPENITSSESADDDFAAVDLGRPEPDISTVAPEPAQTEFTADVETVIGDEICVPVDDFFPDGLVSITESAAGGGQAIVNEFIPGEAAPGVDVADEPAVVAESISTTELPETRDPLPDAPIEGLGELSTADALPTAESDVNIDELEWLDDASPMESVADQILGEQTGSGEPVAEAIAPVEEAVTPTQALIGSESDLDFSDLDFGDAIEEVGEPVAEAEPAAAEPAPFPPSGTFVESVTSQTDQDQHHNEPDDEPENAIGFIRTEEIKPRPGPSLFGFDFEGGSFLGGMPLQLNAPPPAVPISKAGSAVFDMTGKAPTGLGGALAPSPTRSRAGAAMPGLGIATPAPVAPPISPLTPPRPMTPPRPAANPVRADAGRLSLTGLGTESRPARPGMPEIPPTARESGADKASEPPRPLPPGAAAAAVKPRSLDVFSQMASPIGIEVFGGKVAEPGKVQIPDSKETRALAEAEYPGETEAAGDQAPVAAAYTPPPRRRSKIPLLLIMMFVFPLALLGAIFSFVPSTAKIIGTIRFEGGTGQDSHQFGINQINRLRESSIGNTARAMLINHKIPAGFTDDPAAYSKAMVDNPQAVTWEPGTGSEPGTLRFEFGSVEYPGLNLKTPDTGKEQVKAVLTALQSADQDLIDIRARAQAARDAATEARGIAQQNVAAIQERRRVQLQLAQDFLDPAKIEQLDKDAARLKQEWTDTNTKRQTSESLLADLRDPTKPMDADTAEKVKSLRQRIANLNDQIAKLRSSNGSNAAPAGKAVTAATTQPAADTDPFIAPLQKQADDLNLSLTHLLDVLAADAALTAEQRAENRDRQIENMTTSLTALERAEQDAKQASDTAAAAAAAAHKQKDDADVAGARADELGQQLMTAQQALKQAIDDEKDKQAALESCITVAAGDNAGNSPISVVREDLFEPQWPIWGGSSALVVLVLCFMIYAEATRPAVVPGVTPTAAPLVNPPLRTIPWPQPHQLEGLKAGQRPVTVVEEPEQYIGI